MRKLLTLAIIIILSIGAYSCSEEEIKPISSQGEQGMGQNEDGF